MDNSTLRKHREIRDIYNKLRAKYRSDVIMQFIQVNYFYTEDAIYRILSRVDDEPVTTPTIIYNTVMNEDFKL